MLRAAEPVSKDVSVITVNFRTIAPLERMILSFERSRPTISHELIIVENGSTDPTRHLLETRFPWVRYHLAKNEGFSAGNNRGAEIAVGRYLLFLNPDAELTEGAIDTWIAWMDAHPDVAMSGPSIVYPDGSPQASTFRYHKLITPLLRRTRLGDTRWGKKHLQRFEQPFLVHYGDHAEVEWLLGAAICIRREVAYALNGWDERYFLYFEDEDLCRRARKLGHRVVYLPHVQVSHAYGKLSKITSFKDVFLKRAIREHIKSAVKYFWRFRVDAF